MHFNSFFLIILVYYSTHGNTYSPPFFGLGLLRSLFSSAAIDITATYCNLADALGKNYYKSLI